MNDLRTLCLILLVAVNWETEILTPQLVQAQILPDNTLGVESSTVVPTSNQPNPVLPSQSTPSADSAPPPQTPPPQEEINERFLIEGGATRDSNLFHSFREFNINNGQQVNFTSPQGITNILTRVTGNNSSEIFGSLGINGDANLFLINPNGIIFGEGASINLDGTFFASTAKQIDFADGESFSAVNPETSPLLTVNIPLGLQIGNNPASIEARQGRIDAQEVVLLGGNINLEQTTISAPGGKVWLGSLKDTGKINFDGKFPKNVVRGDLNIGDRSLINVVDAGGGNIAVDARNLTLTSSDFQAGIGLGLGEDSAVAGDINLDVTENIILNDSNISNSLEPNSIGNGGKIAIDTTNLIINNSRIVNAAKSTGSLGDIAVEATGKVEVFSSPENVEADGTEARKGVFSIVEPNALGNGGNISVISPEITLSGLGGIDSSTVGIGNAGKIDLQSDRVSITEGAGVFANGRGIGDAGEIIINATEFIDVSDKLVPNLNSEGRPLPGGIIADVGREAQSNGGNIYLNTGRLSVTNGAIITTDTKGSGDAGNIEITAQELVEVVGRNQGDFPSQIVSAVRKNKEGNGGNIAIATKNFSVRDGGAVNVGTQGQGNSGNLSILASEAIDISGTSVSRLPSRLTAQVGEDATGEGGDIFLSAENLSIRDGGQISASTLGIGAGGSVKVDIQDNTALNGFAATVDESDNPGLSSFIRNSQGNIIPSGIFASSPGLGDADALNLKTSNLTLSNRAQLSVSSFQQGAAGNLGINANEIDLDNSILSAETVEGDRANIFLESENIQLRNHSLITTNARETATGGNIAIDTNILLALDDSDITANAVDNFGGQVSISALGVFGIQSRENRTLQSDITATSRLGAEFSGVVDINLDSADPTVGTLKLPDNLFDASQQITSNCKSKRDNSFIVTGRGGIPASPQEMLRGQTILQDWRLATKHEPQMDNHEQLSTSDRKSNIVEASKIVIDQKGTIQLVADSQEHSGDLWSQSLKCDS